MTFRTSELAARPLPNLGTPAPLYTLRGCAKLLPIFLLIALSALSGCASLRGGRSWYGGPAHLKGPTEAAINTAIAELSGELRRPLKFRWDKDRTRSDTIL
jgi:hypothetical protein